MRESLMDAEPAKLDDEVEIDAAYVNGHVRPTNRIQNRIQNRVDHRLKAKQDSDKHVLLVLRELHENEGEGGYKTVTAIAKTETEASVEAYVARHVEAGMIISADESNACNSLHAKFKIERVNHSVEYVAKCGANKNQAESFFSRIRRMQLGQVHCFGNLYLDRYAKEAPYREDTRRKPNGAIFGENMQTDHVSRDYCGYRQGYKKQSETLYIKLKILKQCSLV